MPKVRPPVLYLDPNSLVGAPVVRTHEEIVAELKKQIGELQWELVTAKAERDDFRFSAEMACENPDPTCRCPGCSLADERARRGEL